MSLPSILIVSSLLSCFKKLERLWFAVCFFRAPVGSVAVVFVPGRMNLFLVKSLSILLREALGVFLALDEAAEFFASEQEGVAGADELCVFRSIISQLQPSCWRICSTIAVGSILPSTKFGFVFAKKELVD